MNKNSLEFINIIEGYKLRVLEIHWSSNIDSKHQLTNDIYKDMTLFQDKLVESLQGYYKTRIEVGDVKPMLPNSKTLDKLFIEMENDLIGFMKFLTSEKQNGIKFLINECQYKINQWVDRNNRV